MAHLVTEIFGCAPIGYKPSKSLLHPYIYVGPEVELEGWNMNDTVFRRRLPHWKLVGDGSLRMCGQEVVAKKPLAGKDLIMALRELGALKRLTTSPPTFSERTSTHLHINITNLTAEEVAHTIANYVVYAEPSFFKLGFTMFDRKHQTYCRPIRRHERLSDLMALYDAGHYDDFVREFSQHVAKYNALFLNALFGTLEFRMFNATLSSLLILKWVNACTDFLEAAKYLPVASFSATRKETKARLKLLFPNMYRLLENELLAYEPFKVECYSSLPLGECLPDLSSFATRLSLAHKSHPPPKPKRRKVHKKTVEAPPAPPYLEPPQEPVPVGQAVPGFADTSSADGVSVYSSSTYQEAVSAFIESTFSTSSEESS